MLTLSRALLIIAMLAASTLARSDGIQNFGNPSDGITGGISGISAAAAVIPGCSGTGLIFTSACNSQYIGIL